MIFSKFIAYIHSPPSKYVLSDPLLSTESTVYSHSSIQNRADNFCSYEAYVLGIENK